MDEIIYEDNLSLFGRSALRGMFVYSNHKLIDEYVSFLQKSVNDESMGDIRNHIQQELNEFEVTRKDVEDYFKSTTIDILSAFR